MHQFQFCAFWLPPPSEPIFQSVISHPSQMLTHLGSSPSQLLISGKLRPTLPRDSATLLWKSGAALTMDTGSEKSSTPVCCPPPRPCLSGEEVRDVKGQLFSWKSQPKTMRTQSMIRKVQVGAGGCRICSSPSPIFG